MKQKYTLLVLLLLSLAAWPLAWPPGPLPWLLTIIYIPVLGLIESEERKGGLNTWILFLYCLLSGFLRIGWISQVSWTGAIIPVLISAMLETSAFLFLKRSWGQSSTELKRWISIAGFISLWILLEWLKDHWFTLSWLNLGMGLAMLHPFIQWYEFTGPFGGTTLVLILNFLAYPLIRTFFLPVQPKSRSGIIALLWLSLLILPAIGSYFRYTHYEDFKSRKSYENYHHLVNMVLVQSNLNPQKKFSGSSDPDLKELLSLSKKAAKSNTEYILWPETALGVQKGFDEDSLSFYPNLLKIRKFLVPYPNITLVTGAITYRTNSYSSVDTSWFNAAMQLENDDNISVYHKQILVPGVEKSPFSLGYPLNFPYLDHPSGNSLSLNLKENSTPAHPSENSISRNNSVSPFMYLGGIHHYFTADAKPRILYSQSGLGLGTLICFESAFSDFGRKIALNGASIFVILSNDAWWGNSPAAYQHKEYARLLAIENRRSLAQSSNGGFSFIINQKGDLEKEIPLGVKGAINGDLEINEEISFYTRYGDWILYPMGLVFLSSLAILYGLPILSKKN